MLVRTSRSSGSDLDLGRMVGGVLFTGFILRMTTQPPGRVGATGSGGFWCPLVPGTHERPGASGGRGGRRGVSFPPRAWGPPGAGARDTPPLPCPLGTRRGAEADFLARAWLPHKAAV